MFEPEQSWCLLAGLDADLVQRLLEWEARAHTPGARRLLRAEATFRGQAVFIAELVDAAHDAGPGGRVLAVMRAMSPDWQDAVRNGLYVARSAERFGLDPGDPAPTLEAWLAWQERERVGGDALPR